MSRILFTAPLFEALTDDLDALSKWISKKYGLGKITKTTGRKIPAIGKDGREVIDERGAPVMVDERIPVSDFIVDKAREVLFHSFSLGDDRVAVARITGEAAIPEDEGVARRLNPENGQPAVTLPIGDDVDNLSDGVKSLVTVFSKRFAIGMMRIAFDELGLLKYLIEIHEALAVALEEGMGADRFNKFVDGLDEFDSSRLRELAHDIIPEYVLGHIIAREQPYEVNNTIIKAIGKNNLQRLADEYDPIDIDLNSNLATPDGKVLGFTDLERVVGVSGKAYEDTLPERMEKYVPRKTEDEANPDELEGPEHSGNTPVWEDGMVAHSVDRGMLNKANLNFEGSFRKYTKGRWTVCHITKYKQSNCGILTLTPFSGSYGEWGQFKNITHWCITGSEGYWNQYSNYSHCSGEAFYMFRDDFLNRGDNKLNSNDEGCTEVGFAFFTRDSDGLVNVVGDGPLFQDNSDHLSINSTHFPGRSGFDWDGNGQFPECANCRDIPLASGREEYEALSQALSAYVLFLVGADLSNVPVEAGERKRAALADLMKIYFPTDNVTGEAYDDDVNSNKGLKCNDCYEVTRIINDMGPSAPRMFTIGHDFFTPRVIKNTPFVDYMLYVSPDAPEQLIARVFNNWDAGERVKSDEKGFILARLPDGKVKALTGFPVELGRIMVNAQAGVMEIYDGNDKLMRTLRLFRPEDSPAPQAPRITDPGPSGLVPRGARWSIQSRGFALYPDERGNPVFASKRAGGNPSVIGNVRLGNLLETLSHAREDGPVSIIPVDVNAGRLNILMRNTAGEMCIAYVNGSESDASRALQTFIINPRMSDMTSGALILEPCAVNLAVTTARNRMVTVSNTCRVGRVDGGFSSREYLGPVRIRDARLDRAVEENPNALMMIDVRNSAIVHAVDKDTLQETGQYNLGAPAR